MRHQCTIARLQGQNRIAEGRLWSALPFARVGLPGYQDCPTDWTSSTGARVGVADSIRVGPVPFDIHTGPDGGSPSAHCLSESIHAARGSSFLGGTGSDYIALAGPPRPFTNPHSLCFPTAVVHGTVPVQQTRSYEDEPPVQVSWPGGCFHAGFVGCYLVSHESQPIGRSRVSPSTEWLCHLKRHAECLLTNYCRSTVQSNTFSILLGRLSDAMHHGIYLLILCG